MRGARSGVVLYRRSQRSRTTASARCNERTLTASSPGVHASSTFGDRTALPSARDTSASTKRRRLRAFSDVGDADQYPRPPLVLPPVPPLLPVPPPLLVPPLLVTALRIPPSKIEPELPIFTSMNSWE